jgi:hypothetical protein
MNAKLQNDVGELRQQLEEAVDRIELIRSEEALKTKAKLEKEDEASRYELKLQEFNR